MSSKLSGKTVLSLEGDRRAYRFAIHVDKLESQLDIWLEDCVSKKQWQTRKLPMNAFLSDRNSFPGASISDYSARFAECLTGTNDADKACLRSISGTVDSCRLDLSMTLRCLTFSTTVAYTFELQLVPLERIDVVEAKLRDYGDVIHQMPKSLAFAQFKLKTGTQLFEYKWEQSEDVASSMEDFQVSSDSKAIVIMTSGVYHIHAEVEMVWKKSCWWTLMVNCSVVDTAQRRTLSRLCRLKEGDRVSVKTQFNNTMDSVVMILRQLQ